MTPPKISATTASSAVFVAAESVEKDRAHSANKREILADYTRVGAAMLSEIGPDWPAVHQFLFEKRRGAT